MALPIADLPAPRDDRLIAVSTTGIFCRPGCPAPAPLPGHVERMARTRDALFAGYRPCLRCTPLTTHRDGVTDAELRRADHLRPVLRSARTARRRRSGAASIVVTMLRTPLGPMLAGATDDGICLLEFTDRRMLPAELEDLPRRLRRPLVAGHHPHLDRLRVQLAAYFAGERVSFDLPIVTSGSDFQQRTWEELRRIAPGTTVSYEELARRVGSPAAVRAIGTANGANRLALVIPCHRVIRKNGETGNYGGGQWRKAWLLAHEAAFAS